jgi:GNAT superfamily N-acetyltransferase
VTWSVVSGHVDERTRELLTSCWVDVSNAGGAVGFPHPPVDHAQVRAATNALAARVAAGHAKLVVAADADGVCGWVVLDFNSFVVMRHGAWVRRRQSHPRRRGQGLGKELLRRLEEVARQEGLEFLRLTLRDGLGLDEFYGRLGWQQVGRVPGALRVAPGDDRDELHMVKPLHLNQA